MNVRKHNTDLLILQREGPRPRFSRVPGWVRVDWSPTNCGGNMIYLRQVSLPPSCSVERTDVKIEAPPNLYEPAGDGLLFFYRNIWISPGIRLLDHRRRRSVQMPRLFHRDADGFAYLCLHPDPVTPEKNVLDFVRVMDLFLLNPGYKAGVGEQV
jgi:hypothetical protein